MVKDVVAYREKLAQVPEDESQLAYGNTVYGIKFDSREAPDPSSQFGHRYTFFLQDAVEEVPEYVVYWDQFLECVQTLSLCCRSRPFAIRPLASTNCVLILSFSS